MTSNLLEKRQANKAKLKIPLRLILTVPFVLLMVGTTGLVGYLSLQNCQRSVNNLANQLMTEVSDRIYLYLSNYLKTPDLINRLNARASQMGQIDINDPQSLERYFFGQIQEFNSARIHFINPQGGLVGAGNDDRGLTVSLTKNFTKGRLYIYGVDSQGQRQKLLVNQQNYDATQRPFYQKAFLANKPTWTPIFVYVPTSRGLGIAASYPLYNQTKQLQGVFTSDLTLVTISEFLKKLRVGTHGQVFIIERSGLMVASSTTEQPFVNDKTQNKRLNVIESKESLIRLAAQHLISRFGNLTQIKTAQQLEFKLEGKKQFLLVTPYSDQLGLDWLIVTVVPESDFMAQVDLNTRVTVLLSVGALAFAIAVGLLITQIIVRPVQQLGQASLALADEEWNQAIEQDTPIAEIQVLSDSFHRMTQQLGQSFERVNTALQESEALFTKVFRTCPNAIGIVTLEDEKCVDVNDAFTDMLGFTRDETIGRAVTKIGYWVNRDDRKRYLEHLKAGKQVRNWELVVRHKTGRLLTVLFSADIIELQGKPHIIAVTQDISDRKLAELELRQQKDLRESIYNESADALFLVDPETLLIADCNHRAVELFEADSKTEIIGIKGHTLQLRPFTSDELSDIIAQMNQKGLWSQEIEYITRKGNLFWGNLAAKRVLIANHIIYLVRVTDITECKQIEEALRQSEARFKQIAAVSPAQIYILAYYPDRHEMRYEYISPGVREIQELEPEQVLEDALLTYNQVHSDDRDLYNQLTTRSLKTLEPFAHEWRIITPSGKMKWVRANSRPERRENGEIAWYGVLLDITDLKQAESSLRESEERFRHAFHDAPIGMALLGLKYRWLQINPMLAEMLGYSQSETLTVNAFELIHPEDVTKLQHSIKQVLTSENRNAQVELRYLCNGDRIAWGLTSLSLVRDFQNQPLYYVAQIQDITDQHAIDRMKHEFISIVSHELRTPLTAIQGFLGLLNTGIYDNKPDKAKWMLQQAMTNSDRLVRLVNDILDLERLSAGQVQLAKEVCNAEDLMQRAVEGVQSIAIGATVRLSIISTTARVWASPDLIIQTLTNLLSNAIKFSPPNSVITLSAQPQAGSVLFQVKDQGRGIPAEKLETIFERFQQVDVSDARAKGGTGLGLAICQSIVQKHDGSIWAESNLGEGSTFYFTLPIALGEL